MKNEPLGIDYAAAVERAETILLPAFDAGDPVATLRKSVVPAGPAHSIGCSRVPRRQTLHQIGGPHTAKHHEAAFASSATID